MEVFRSYVAPNTRLTVWARQYGHKLSVVRRVLVKVVVHLKKGVMVLVERLPHGNEPILT